MRGKLAYPHPLYRRTDKLVRVLSEELTRQRNKLLLIEIGMSKIDKTFDDVEEFGG